MRAAVIGATGYTGLILVKLIISHPNMELTVVTSDTYKNNLLSDVFPELKNLCNIELKENNINNIKNNCDIAFLCLPHGTSFSIVKSLYDAGKIVIDLSADFRFSDVSIYNSTYNLIHPYPNLLENATYGIPEIFSKEIKKSRIIANPGCYPTSVIMPIYPLLEKKLIDTSFIIADSKSGVSGAGKKATEKTHFCEVNEDFKAYSVFTHRHNPEMNHILSKSTVDPVDIIFVPHLLPTTRGIETTIYTRSTHNLEKLYAELLDFYKDCFFVRLSMDRPASIKNVNNTNFIDISLFKRDDTIVITSAIDNLMKGASGQAIQNLNIMAGFNEKEGLI